MTKEYDYLIVGSGLFGSVFAYRAKQSGKRCLVVEKRSHAGGNVYCETVEGINVHKYGAHIFHTSDREVWDFVNDLVEFNGYINAPVANYKGTIYNLPFNMNTFSKMWNITTPAQARAMIENQRKSVSGEPANLEEQAISLVGVDIYEKLIKSYTQKQWGKSCTELPAFIIKRLPVRYVYDNNYFNDRYQGIPVGGYQTLIDKLLDGVSVKLNTDYFSNREKLSAMADKIVYTGLLDEYFDFCFGALEYRSLRFETEILELDNFQGNAVVNYTDPETPYTRIIEHKHFEFGKQKKTVVTREYSMQWEKGMEPYYPINNDHNQAIFEQYWNRAQSERNVIFGGRLAEYKYYDMDKVIRSALDAAAYEFK
ncbi:MAG TPA: UDP-galactopyranose mutase [Ruminococcaceae bacterium]|nr:UDP-galactopyranose mutase [Oscillospiraceae bacterium]